MAPFFSIGVTTYDRKEMLLDTINSISGQSFSDFEVIVSNDNPSRLITGESLGISDSRFRFINQTKNLGERNNMNFILKESKGRYFTWLADDDLYHPDFLMVTHSAITKHEFPPCVFTSYTQSSGAIHNQRCVDNESQLLTGRQFLRAYLSRLLIVQGCYGIFDAEYIKRIGGIGKLGSGFSYCNADLPGNVFFPYADTLLVIRSCLLEKLIFINEPLIFYRIHEGAVSVSSRDLSAYRSAQEELCSESIKIFNSAQLRDDFRLNLFLLLKWYIVDFIAVAKRAGSIDIREIIRWVIFLRNYACLLKSFILYCKVIEYLIKITAVELLLYIRDKLSALFNRK